MTTCRIPALEAREHQWYFLRSDPKHGVEPMIKQKLILLGLLTSLATIAPADVAGQQGPCDACFIDAAEDYHRCMNDNVYADSFCAWEYHQDMDICYRLCPTQH